jgi:hypothetical protein
MSLSYSGNVRLIRITKSIEYNIEEDEYLVTSFRTGQKYVVFRLNKYGYALANRFSIIKKETQRM